MNLPIAVGRGEVYCDKCGKFMDLRRLAIESERLTKNRVGYFFRCEHCNAVYRFMSITPEGRRMLEKIKTLRTRIADTRKRNDVKEYSTLLRQHETMMKAYQKEVGGPYTDEEVLQHG